MEYNVEKIRRDFPGLDRSFYGHPMVYLDNTATSQTPRQVVEEIERLYYNHKANVHRGVSSISQEATDRQEATRRRVAEWIGAGSVEEVIFTRGTTESINLVAASFGQRFKEGDEIILTVMEHHSNIVPWQLLAMRTGIRLRVVPLGSDNSTLDFESYRLLFNDRTVMASFCHVSNVLGTVNPVSEMIAIAHSHGVPVLVDGAQAVPHMKVDVTALDADFYVFSSHKMYGPTGIGVLYGKRDLLESMPPYQGGAQVLILHPHIIPKLPRLMLISRQHRQIHGVQHIGDGRLAVIRKPHAGKFEHLVRIGEGRAVQGGNTDFFGIGEILHIRLPAIDAGKGHAVRADGIKPRDKPRGVHRPLNILHVLPVHEQRAAVLPVQNQEMHQPVRAVKDQVAAVEVCHRP